MSCLILIFLGFFSLVSGQPQFEKDLYPFGNVSVDTVPLLPENLVRQMSSMPRDCAEILDSNGGAPSGVYTIFPATAPGQSSYFNVFCDMDNEGGGWTVIQRRCDGSTDFYRGWYFYRNGFGDVENEYYLGNERIHWLTTQKQYELKVCTMDVGMMNMTAGYSHFYIGNETDKYGLHVDTYYGDAGDYLTKSNGMPFSTFDHDHDVSVKNCAAYFHSAWWYSGYGDCSTSTNINGYYFLGRKELPQFSGPGMSWAPVPGPGGPALKKVVMKIRPMGFLGTSRVSYGPDGSIESNPNVPPPFSPVAASG